MRFLVTSAINNDERRCYELLGTLESVWKRFPLAEIILTESSLHRPDNAYLKAIPNRVIMVPFWGEQFVSAAHETNRPRGYVQNAIEIQVMLRVLDLLTDDINYKLSGRYQLTDDFSPESHHPDKFVFKRKIPTGFTLEQCGTTHMLMTRCYGIPGSKVDLLRDALRRSLGMHEERWSSGGVFDIEHGLYEFLPAESIQEVEKIGVIGRIGHLEHIVED